MSVGVRFEEVSMTLGGRLVLKHASFTIRPAERTAFLGPNGGGKTTLVKILLGIVAPDEGRVLFLDESGKEIPAPRIGYLSQRSTLTADAPLSGLDLVSLLLSPKAGFRGLDHAAEEAKTALVRAR